jgi:CheY-like chemotaxis protein
MDKLERLAGRVAQEFNRLASGNPEEILETATLVSELTEELASTCRLPEACERPRSELEGGTALLVDSRPEDREAVRPMLEASGYEVLEAACGADAFSLCASHDGPIRLMLTDMLMRDMSGRELAERASSLRPEMSVIYMSGYAGDEVMSCGILGPGVAALEKPVTAEALAQKLRRAAEVQCV